MNYPSAEQIDFLIEELTFDRITDNKKGYRIAFEKYNSLLKQLNPEPVKPEFPERVKYLAKSINNVWVGFRIKPYYKDGRWQTDLSYNHCGCFASVDQVLWLEHINKNKPASECLIERVR